MRKFALFIAIYIFGCGAVFADVSVVDYDAQSNLLSISADRQPVISLLDVMASEAKFSLILDERSAGLTRKISINLIQVPLERAINLVLGNINRVIIYSTAVRKQKQVEKVVIFSSEGDYADNSDSQIAAYSDEQARGLNTPIRYSHSRLQDIEQNRGDNQNSAYRPKHNQEYSQEYRQKLRHRLKQKLQDQRQKRRFRSKLSEQKLMAHIDSIQQKLMGETYASETSNSAIENHSVADSEARGDSGYSGGRILVAR